MSTPTPLRRPVCVADTVASSQGPDGRVRLHVVGGAPHDDPAVAAHAPGPPAAHQHLELLLRVHTPAVAVDVVVDVDSGHTVAELTAALARQLGVSGDGVCLSSARTGETMRPEAVVGDVELASGDELHLGPPPDGGGRRPRPPRRAIAVDVVAGPDSGRSRLLRPGTFSVGRRRDADISIDDPSVSRHHAELDIDAVGDPHRDPVQWLVTVEPMADTANGVTVNDEPIDAATEVVAGDVIGLGGTRLAFRPFERSELEHVDRLGQIEFHRTPYRPPVVAERETDPIGPIPQRPEPRRLQVFAVLAPLAAGVLMYGFTRQLQFLALTLVSPIVVVSSVVEDRRTGRRNFGIDLAEFRAALVEHRRRFAALRHDERVERLRSAPDLASLVRRAQLRTSDLWARGRAAPDFLTVRLGLGTAGVRFPIELDRGGDDDLRAEALAAVDGLDTIDNVPVTVGFEVDPVLGVHGDPDLVDGVAASILAQAATLHSPADLVVAAAVAPERPLAWVKWLPHGRSVTSPIPGDHLVGDVDAAHALLGHLVELATVRAAGGGAGRDASDDHCWPRLLVVLDGALDLDAATVSRLLDLAPAAGIRVVWLTGTGAGVPRHASRVLEVRRGVGAEMLGRLWSTDPETESCDLEVEHLRHELADRAARALAPVRDASTASFATSIPRSAPLLDVLGVGTPSPRWVQEQWARSTAYDLRFPIGIDADGAFELDLVHDGPHTLIGGTSGAGKSELLQSMVAGLAARYSPTRLNFLFVDYKGGASTKVFERLPHTVGAVTNLSADLSLRALTSLRAELTRRMGVLEGRAKDLAEMLERFPDDAPASLVIVVDEFATLVKEVPDFVAGIIDIAQRGRSLGIHLVLATQRPSGSVNENILANTNLRIALRMLERTESSSIIDSPDAADIPVPLKGRALARLGPRKLVEFQSAFAGAPVVTAAARQPVLVAEFRGTADTPRAPSAGAAPHDGATHLDVLIDAIADAADELRLPEPRRPWCEVLPEVVVLDDVLAARAHEGATVDAGRLVTVGLLDLPEEQAQRPAVIDLEEGGGLLVFGSGGAGKTTLLRTVAASIGADERGDAAIVVLDFASRSLIGLRELPAVVDVATGDDLEAVTRHLTRLGDEIERRRRLLAAAGAEHLTAYRRDRPTDLARVVVLIDGFGALVSTMSESAGAMSSAEQWGELVQRLIVDGRQVGIHTIITADRRTAVPSRLHSAIANRLVLRHADETSYAEHGIAADRARSLDLSPGRGLLDGVTVVQIASVSSDPAARSQSASLSALAAGADRSAREQLGSVGLGSTALADRVSLDDVDALVGDALVGDGSRTIRAALGLADVSGAPVVVDLDWSHLVVCGGPRSGRSTALATMARGLDRHHDLVVVGSSRSPLAALGLGQSAFGGVDEIAPELDQLAARLAARTDGATTADDSATVLVVDDVDALDDSMLTPLWERLAAFDDLRLVVSLEERSMSGYTMNALVNVARRARRVLVLQPDDPAEFLQTTGVKLPCRPGLRMPVGRGVLLVDRQPTIVQVALHDVVAAA